VRSYGKLTPVSVAQMILDYFKVLVWPLLVVVLVIVLRVEVKSLVARLTGAELPGAKLTFAEHKVLVASVAAQDSRNKLEAKAQISEALAAAVKGELDAVEHEAQPDAAKRREDLLQALRDSRLELTQTGELVNTAWRDYVTRKVARDLSELPELQGRIITPQSVVATWKSFVDLVQGKITDSSNKSDTIAIMITAARELGMPNDWLQAALDLSSVVDSRRGVSKLSEASLMTMRTTIMELDEQIESQHPHPGRRARPAS
jgi:hypothetical protein